MKRVLLLGSTGSIGCTTLRVLSELKATHRVVGLAAGGKNPKKLMEQIRFWHPDFVAIAEESAAARLRSEIAQHGAELFVGPDAPAAMTEQAPADIVVSGIVGAAGLASSLAALRRGVDLALANKESMVVAGPVLSQEAARSGARLLPVDSEHSAIFQCLHGESPETVRRVILTASGGPFRKTPAEELARVTPEQALRHPTWNMGAKITIDSATLMNKALEVVEARWLFGLRREQIDAVVHPQSIVHSMVEFRDGSLLAQLGVPDMAVPIRYALSYPGRNETKDCYFDLEKFGTLTFEAPDLNRFPALNLGFEAARLGGTAGAVLNAANEVAVESFLDGEISFPDIARINATTMDHMNHIENPSLEQLLEADRWAREEARACLC